MNIRRPKGSHWKHLPTPSDVAYSVHETELAAARGGRNLMFGYEWVQAKRVPQEYQLDSLESRWIMIGLLDDDARLLPADCCDQDGNRLETRRRLQVFRVPLQRPRAVSEYQAFHAAKLLDGLSANAETVKLLTAGIGKGPIQ